ncbi:MAG TPA: fumarylacetoacetate hydrolase family protein [Stellaceae bacterium]|nr:fumarylacetoacetate hydrolase family protein [Stellaceae bacterium]
MKLATLRNGRPDGEVVVVARDLRRMERVGDIAPTLQAALDDWASVRPRLQERSLALNAGRARNAEPFDQGSALSPLPRAYQWCDGSVYRGHSERMAKWVKRPVDPRWFDEPWMYQGASDCFLAPTEDIPGVSEDWGIDYEGEIAIVTDAVPYGTSKEDAGRHVALVMLANDVSLRNLMGAELSKGFGFVQTKPASAFSPVAATPDELGDAWRECRLHRPLVSHVNGAKFGDPDAGEMTHGFDRLIAHVAKTRPLSPGSIIGSGTVSSLDQARGVSCLAEQRVIETLEHGAPKTPFLRFGDRVRIEMFDADGVSIFGAIDQKVVKVGR